MLPFTIKAMLLIMFNNLSIFLIITNFYRYVSLSRQYSDVLPISKDADPGFIYRMGGIRSEYPDSSKNPIELLFQYLFTIVIFKVIEIPWSYLRPDSDPLNPDQLPWL